MACIAFIYIYEKAEHIIKKKQKGAFIFLNTIIRVMLLLVGGCDRHTAVIFALALMQLFGLSFGRYKAISFSSSTQTV